MDARDPDVRPGSSPMGRFRALAGRVRALAARDAPPPVPHHVEGNEACLMCHDGRMPYVAEVPAGHEGKGNETCLGCHTVGPG